MESFKAICDGRLISLQEVNDPVFSEKMMGDGCAFLPSGSIVSAPLSGEVTMIYPTGHALGITSDEGFEVLIHVGLNSFTLGDQAIRQCVKVGDRVSAGQQLLDVDFDVFRAHNIDTVIPVVFTSGQRIELSGATEVVMGQESIVTIYEES